MRLLIIFVIICNFQAGFGQQQQRQRQQNEFERMLIRHSEQPSNWQERPGPPNAPTPVEVNVYLRRITPVANGVDLELTFRQTWTDSRLAYRGPPAFSSIHALDNPNRRIWMPDTFFQTAYDVKMHSTPNPNELVRVNNSGDVLLSQRLQLTVPCPTPVKGLQECSLDLASYGNTAEHIVYVWKSDNPVQIRDGIKSTGTYELTRVDTETCTQSTNTGTYSCLRAKLIFKSHAWKSVMSKLHMIPLLLVVISWLPMILNAQSIALRAIIGLVCLATLILHWSIIGEAGLAFGADVWLSRCLGFIAATFIQLIFFAWIIRGSAAYKERRLAKMRAIRLKDNVTNDETIVLVQTEPVVTPREDRYSVGLIVDIISLAIFILAFLVFLLHYFNKY